MVLGGVAVTAATAGVIFELSAADQRQQIEQQVLWNDRHASLESGAQRAQALALGLFAGAALSLVGAGLWWLSD
jgi:hypothetical protein